jgi:chain length determinant protein EpsF
VNPYLFISALRARFGVFFMVLVVTIIATAVVSILLPKTYKATVSLLVDAKEEQSLSNELASLMMSRERVVGYLQTQTDILTSQKVARNVARELKLADDPKVQEDFVKAAGTGRIDDWLAAALLEELKVETSQSSVIHVSYSARDPEFAAQVANAFAKAYIDATLELRVEPTRQAATWFDEQLKSLRVNLEDAQAKLTEYHKRQGIVSADERLDIENTRLSELSSQSVRMQDQTYDLKSREQMARDYVRRGGSMEDLPEVLANPHIQKLRTDVLVAEAKLQELGTQYGPNYPQYQRQRSEIQGLREKLDAEMKKVVTGMEASARQSREREAEINRSIAMQRARLLEMKVGRNDLAVLTRNVESAQRAYDTAMQRSVVSRVESRANRSNATVLNPASVPTRPFRPKVGLNVALSVVVGTMLGLGIVILMELLDRRVRSRNDLEIGLEAPLLVELNAWRPAENRLLGWRDTGRALPSPS